MVNQKDQSEDQEPQDTQADGSGDGQSDAPEVDWQARAEQAESELAKEKHRVRSIEGNQRKQRERDDQAEAMSIEIGALSKAMEAMGRGLSAPEEEREGVAREISALNQEAALSRRKGQAARLVAEQQAQIQEMNTNEDGTPIFDVNTAPELADARALWDAGETGAANLEFNRQVIAKQRAEARKAIEAERKAARDGRKKAAGDALEKAGLHDTSVPSRGGGGSKMSYTEAAKALNNGEITTREFAQYRRT